MEFIVIGLVVLAGLYIAFRPKKVAEVEVVPYKVSEPVVLVTKSEIVQPDVAPTTPAKKPRAKKAPAVKKAPAAKKPAVKAKTARKPRAV